MTSKYAKSYLLLFAMILLLMSIPKQSSEKIKGLSASFLAPGWNSLNSLILSIKSLVGYPSIAPPSDLIEMTVEEKIEFLEIKNQKLISEIEKMKEKNFQKLQKNEIPPDPESLIPARVIFRTPDLWNSSLWINIGNKDNEKYGYKAIAKNSPVLLKNCLVGVVDFVGTHQSRVRLITDSGIKPSVRAIRGNSQKKLLLEQLLLAKESLLRHGSFLSDHDVQIIVHSIDQVIAQVPYEERNWYLAKGEIYGRSQPLWRSPSQFLKGIGFNYDFPDDEGPARDLRSGKIQNSPAKSPALALLKINDLLETTGMDGVFPKGLLVAIVTKIEPLKEGDYYYELEAKPAAGDLDELSLVFVMPPLGYDADDQPLLY